MISYRAVINGIEVNAHYSTQAVNRIFVPFLDRMSELQKQKGRRLLVMLAAPPGAGKTTLLSFLEKLWQERGGTQHLQVIGMDGFHRRQEYLKSHFVQREGNRVSMVQIKGAPVTFDLERLAESVRNVAEGKKADGLSMTGCCTTRWRMPSPWTRTLFCWKATICCWMKADGGICGNMRIIPYPSARKNPCSVPA